MEQNVLPKKENFNAVDVAKFFLAFCVISIHTCYKFFDNDIANAIVGSVIIRLAVPFFFVASGFFFFRDIIFENGRIKKCPENRAKLFSFLKRILMLYLAWAVIYLVWEIFAYLDFGLPLSSLLKGFFSSLLFSGYPGHFWYLLFSMYTILILFALLRFLRVEIVGIIAGVAFVFFLYGYTYQGVLNTNFLKPLVAELFLLSIPNSGINIVLYAIYLSIGFIFAGLSCTCLRKRISKKLSGILALISLCLSITEVSLVNIFFGPALYSYSLFLLPTATFGFIFLSKIRLNGNSKIFAFFRKGSSFIYCSHVLIMMIFNHFTNRQFVYKPVLFFIISGASLVATLIIVPLSSKLKFLKRLY